MEHTFILAKILGPYLFIVGLGFLVNQRACQSLFEDFKKNLGLLYFGGAIALLFGLLIINIHNTWVFKWAVIITIIGWISFIKGAFLIINPSLLIKITEGYFAKPNVLRIHLIIEVLIGAILMYIGYLA